MQTQSFQKIMRELEKRIHTGIYTPESALPSRTELIAEFKVARATVERAIRELIRSGVLISRQGSGTFVAPHIEKKYRVAQIGGGNFFHEFTDLFDLTPFPPSEFSRKSEWKRLLKFDALLWVRPEAALFSVIEAIGSQMPQMLVNRVVPGIPYVSTDHRGAYRKITAERLAAMPDACPVFLQNEQKSLATDYRFDGFTDACREAERFYELLAMPVEFNDKLSLLNKRLQYTRGKRMIVVSDSLAQSGAFLRWGTEHGVSWGEDVFYSDFDNDYPENVWGVAVTSFLQDHTALYQEAVIRLLRMLDGTPDDEPGKLVFPQFRNGRT